MRGVCKYERAFPTPAPHPCGWLILTLIPVPTPIYYASYSFHEGRVPAGTHTQGKNAISKITLKKNERRTNIQSPIQFILHKIF